MNMSTFSPTAGRLRAYLHFIVAVLWFFLARGLAHRLALGEATEPFVPLVEQAILAFLLLLGYAAMGFWLDSEAHPVSAQGLPFRSGWPGEADSRCCESGPNPPQPRVQDPSKVIFARWLTCDGARSR